MPLLKYRKPNGRTDTDYVPTISVMDSAGKQLWIPVWHGVVFQSYGANVAYVREGRVHVYKPYWNMYSQTTNKYLLQFLRESSIDDIRKKVKSGEYIELE